ncbi:MAG: hypothetical protein ACYDH0_07045 [Candidatus Aminicenantales bacterium]
MALSNEREIYIKASRCHDLLKKSIQDFQDFLRPDTPSGDPEYYKARNVFKEAKVYFADALREAKKLLGPIPVYAPREFQEWRVKTLEDNRIVLRGENPDDLKAELIGDEFIRILMSEGEIEAYVMDHFETQKSGKRKLANIKVRMMLDKLGTLMDQAGDLLKNAQKKQQGLSL